MPDPDQVTIDTTDDADRWKYVCPKALIASVSLNRRGERCVTYPLPDHEK